MKNTRRSYLRYKIFVAIVSLNLLFMVSIAAFNFYRDSVKLSRSKKQDLENTQLKIQETLNYLLLQNAYQNNRPDLKRLLSERVYELANINNVSVTLYSLQGDILVSTKYTRKKLRNTLLKDLMRFRNRLSEEFRPGDNAAKIYSFYGYLYNKDFPVAIISTETTTSKKSLFYHLLVLFQQFSLIILILFIISGYIAWFISKNLTQKIDQLAEFLNRTNVEYLETAITYPENDEIKPLVDAYNNMLVKLEEQTRVLAKMEREDAWRDMARQIAHEINNPLTPLKLSVQNFQRKYDPGDPKNEEKIGNLTQVVVNQIDIIASITRAFSDFANMPVTNDRRTEVVDAVRKAVEIFPDHMVSFRSAAKEIYFNIDPIYLSRIVTNLVKNAIQSITKPEKRVEVFIEDTEDRFFICFRDNGTGVLEENRERVFEKQFTTKSNGKGLGLYMVKKIVEDYGGSIWFETKPDEGSTFTIQFFKNIKKTQI